MNDIDLDGGYGVVSKRYNEENNLDNWSSLAIFKRGTSTALFRI